VVKIIANKFSGLLNISFCPEENDPEMIKTSTSDAARGTLMFTIQTPVVFAKNLSIAETKCTS
jgi:hypothetical protein